MSPHRFVATTLLLMLVARPAFAQTASGVGAAPEPAPSSAPSPAASPAASSRATPPKEEVNGGEMHFGAAKPATDQPASQHPQSMDEFADASASTVAIGNVRTRYSLNFFGDVNAAASSEAGTHPSFALGAQNFLVTGRLEDHFIATSEFAIEIGPDNVPAVDLERLQVGYTSEHFFVRAGRVHTELGYWSTTYHHGKWLSPSIERPRWVAFEDDNGVLPIHTVGVGGGFIADIGPGKLRLTVSVANGRGKIVDDIRNSSDYQLAKLFHSQLEYLGPGDLRFGVSGIVDTIPARPAIDRPALPNTDIREYILGTYVAYPSYPVLLIAEGYLIEHRVPARSFTTFGGFALASYAFGPVTPYLRGEIFVSRGGDDPFFMPDPATTQSLNTVEGIVGVRYDLTTWTALRAEYRLKQIASADPTHTGVLQWCWAF